MRQKLSSQAVLAELTQKFLGFEDSVCLHSDIEFVFYGGRRKGEKKLLAGWGGGTVL